jgi:hypothetical protein
VAVTVTSARMVVASIALVVAASFVAPAAVPWLLPGPAALAASCSGASHAISLTDAGATPRTGTPATTIAFSVVYRDSAGCPPSAVLAIVPGVGQLTLSRSVGSFATGVRFSGSTRLPVGTWTFSFQATAGTGGGVKTATIDGAGSIVIRAPSPSPTATPTPTPTPRPTATPTPTPRATPKPTPKPTPSPHRTPAPASGPGGAVHPSSKPSPTQKPSSSDARSAAPSSSDPPAPSAGWADGGMWEGRSGGIGPGGSDGDGLDDGTVPWPRDGFPRDGSTGSGGTGGGGSGGASARDELRLTGLGLDPETGLSLATWLITTTGGVLLFALLLRRGAEAELLPSELSALILDGRRGSGRGRSRARPDHAETATADTPAGLGTVPEPGAPGAVVRPGRSGATGPRGLPTRPPLAFADSPAPGAIRRTITYRHVRISAGPDDLRFAEVGRLERLDEVEVIGESSGFVQIRTPDDVTGWVPRMVFL